MRLSRWMRDALYALGVVAVLSAAVYGGLRYRAWYAAHCRVVGTVPMHRVFTITPDGTPHFVIVPESRIHRCTS